MPTTADRVFTVVLVVAEEYRTFTPTEVQEAARETFGAEHEPSRRTIYNRLNGLVETGVLERKGKTNKRYRFRQEFDPSR